MRTNKYIEVIERVGMQKLSINIEYKSKEKVDLYI